MGLRKYLAGKILRNDEEKAEQREASKNFTAQDWKELEAELDDSVDRQRGGCGSGCTCRRIT